MESANGRMALLDDLVFLSIVCSSPSSTNDVVASLSLGISLANFCSITKKLLIIERADDYSK